MYDSPISTGILQCTGLYTDPGDLRGVQWEHGNSDGKPLTKTETGTNRQNKQTE